MNYSIIRYLLGWVLEIEGLFLLLPVLVAAIYQENQGIWFFFCAIATVAIGFFLRRNKPKDVQFYAKEGFVTVALTWVVISIVGAIPFFITGEIPNYTDALFEIISGFTTTGASILTNVEGLSHCALFWRSFSHWVGGMGVLVFLLTILPMVGGQSMHLMRAESPGPSVGKLVPKMKTTAKILYGIYMAMTVMEMILLLLAKMPVFDAVCLSLGTAGTGGFGVLNDSCASYTVLQQGIITVFMFLFGVNFNFYYLLLVKKVKDAFKMEEVRAYFLVFAAAVAMITLNMTKGISDLLINIHHAAFQVATIMTTTGFATTDFNNWSEFSRTILVILMFVGACAGSTGGGMKVSRFIIWIKTAKKEMSHLLHPNAIKILKFDGKTIEHDVIRSVNIYMITYVLLFAVSVLVISLDNFDLITNFTAVAATINNIGPGLELVGPTGNFAMFSWLSKYVLMLDMLAGRLELFPMLILLYPSTWRQD